MLAPSPAVLRAFPRLYDVIKQYRAISCSVGFLVTLCGIVAKTFVRNKFRKEILIWTHNFGAFDPSQWRECDGDTQLTSQQARREKMENGDLVLSLSLLLFF